MQRRIHWTAGLLVAYGLVHRSGEGYYLKAEDGGEGLAILAGGLHLFRYSKLYTILAIAS